MRPYDRRKECTMHSFQLYSGRVDEFPFGFKLGNVLYRFSFKGYF